MPEWKRGKGVWTRFCVSCGVPFNRHSKRQDKCDDCINKSYKIISSKNQKLWKEKRKGILGRTIIERMINEL